MEHDKIICEEDISPISKKDYEAYLEQLEELGIDLEN